MLQYMQEILWDGWHLIPAFDHFILHLFPVHYYYYYYYYYAILYVVGGPDSVVV
jgi:hypothetical protein